MCIKIQHKLFPTSQVSIILTSPFSIKVLEKVDFVLFLCFDLVFWLLFQNLERLDMYFHQHEKFTNMFLSDIFCKEHMAFPDYSTCL
jgi:hypothetical protein